MNLAILLCGVVLAEVAGIKADCDPIWIKGRRFYEEHLFSDGAIFSLKVDPFAKDLYFGDWVPNLSAIKLAKINLESKEVSYELSNSTTMHTYAIDFEKKRIMYALRGNRIYYYDVLTNQTTYLSTHGADVHNLYFKQSLYFMNSDFAADIKWYVIENGTHRLVEELEGTQATSKLLIDDSHTFYYYCNHSGLYRQRIGSKDAVQIAELNSFLEVRDMAFDSKGRLYVALTYDVYVLNNQTLQLEQVFPLHSPFSMTIDTEDNFIYSDWRGLFRKTLNRSCT